MTNCFLCDVHFQCHLSDFQYASINLVTPSRFQPIQHLRQMPDRGATFVNRHGEYPSVGQHELAHRLPGNSHNIGHIRQPDKVGGSLNQACGRNSVFDIGQGSANCFLGAVCLAGELQRQATGLPHTDEGVITTSGAQSFDESVQIAVVVSQLVFQRKNIFHSLILRLRIAPALVSGAFVHHPAQRSCVTAGISRRAPHTGDTELTTAAFIVIVGAVDLALGMTTTHFDSPALLFRMLERGFNFLLRM